MEQVDFWAIIAGISAAVAISGLAGLLFGIGMIVDDMRQGGNVLEDEKALNDRFEADMKQGSAGLQLLILSLGAAVVSGALTAWLADQAPLLNAALVGVTGTVLGLLIPMPGKVPALLIYGSALLTLPATLLGAWIMT